MSVKRLHIALLIMGALICATPACAQKPLTKPEKSQFSSEKKTTTTKDENKAVDSKNETIPKYIKTRRRLYDALKADGGQGLGTWDEFNSVMDDENTRNRLYDALQNNGIQGLGTKEEFNGVLAQPKGK